MTRLRGFGDKARWAWLMLVHVGTRALGRIGVPKHQWLIKATLGPCACVHVFVGLGPALC